MNIYLRILAIVLIALAQSCAPPPSELPESQAQILPLDKTVRFDSIDRRGRHLTATMMERFPFGTPVPVDSLGFPHLKNQLVHPLAAQRELLRQRYTKMYRDLGNVSTQPEDFSLVVDHLQDILLNQEVLHDLPFRAVPLAGKNGRGNVQFTGYYAPTLKVRAQPNSTYRYPIYAYPDDWKGALPSRAAIDSKGALAGRGLEIAYAADPVDIYYLQVQGSGYIEFAESGARKYIGFAGTNQRRYRSMETALLNRDDLKPKRVNQSYLKKFLAGVSPEVRQEVLNANPSYTFFEIRNSKVEGAGGVPLTGGYSVAVDPKIIPLGSTLLAAVPVFGERGKVTHHEYRLLFAQDTGGKIKGAGHVDLYFGEGPQAARAAGKMNHYGKLWILLPKPDESLADVNDFTSVPVQG